MVASDWLSCVTCLLYNCKGGWESEVWFPGQEEEGSVSLGDSKGRGCSKQMLHRGAGMGGGMCCGLEWLGRALAAKLPK